MGPCCHCHRPEQLRLLAGRGTGPSDHQQMPFPPGAPNRGGQGAPFLVRPSITVGAETSVSTRGSDTVQHHHFLG